MWANYQTLLFIEWIYWNMLGVWCLCVLKYDTNTQNATILISNVFDALTAYTSCSCQFVYKRKEKNTNFHIDLIQAFEIFKVFFDSNSLIVTHHITLHHNVSHRIVFHWVVANHFKMKINCTNCATLWIYERLHEWTPIIVHRSSIFTA